MREVARVLLVEALVGQEERGQTHERRREVDDGDTAFAAVAGADAALGVHKALAPQDGMVAARDGLDGLTVLQQQEEVLVDLLRVGGQVGSNHVSGDGGAVRVHANDHALAHPGRDCPDLLV